MHVLTQADLAALSSLAATTAAWREGVAAAALAAGWPVAQAGPQVALLVDAGLSVVLRPSLQVIAACKMSSWDAFQDPNGAFKAALLQSFAQTHD